MKTTITKTLAKAGSTILLALAMTPAAKAQLAAVTEGDFEPKLEILEHAPAGLAGVRPTHFPNTPGTVKQVQQGDALARMVGRNVTFRDLLAEAYDCEPGQLVLPPDAPAGGFDFLVTVSPNPRQQLRRSIKQQLGYEATAETRNTDVLRLTLQDPALPGMTNSMGAEADIRFVDGRPYFSHQPMSFLVRGLEDGLGTPIVDQTGLTNFYDFSVPWSKDTTQALRQGGFHLDGVQRVLNEWGLNLKPGTERLEMFTVTKN